MFLNLDASNPESIQTGILFVPCEFLFQLQKDSDL